MTHLEIIEREDFIESLFLNAEIFEDDEIKAHWAKYLCILISGYLEYSVQTIFEKYSELYTNQYVQNFVCSKLERLSNPWMNRIVDLASSFNEDWGAQIRTQTHGELRDSVNGIIRNRNKIAHGENSDITLLQLKSWFENSITVIRIISQECDT